jgi:hypothetical protein
MQTITISTAKGNATITARWCGHALAVHAPFRSDGEPTPRGQWAITHRASGLSVGRFNGSMRNAVRIARLWDGAFETVTVANSRQWPLARQWAAIVKGETAPHAPLHGPEPSPNAHAARPEAVRFAMDAGRPVRTMDGETWQMRWRGAWWPLPTMAELEFWTFDSVCETPDGRTVEPDARDSWLRLLALV